MSSTVYKYRFYSITDSNFQTVWSQIVPSSSNIDPDSVTILDQISTNTVQIQNDTTNTKGNYMLDGFTVDIPGQSNYLAIKQYPYPISCYSIYCYPTISNINDNFSCYSTPFPTINLTSNIQPGQSNIVIPGVFTSYINNGFKIGLSNSSTYESLGRIINVNSNTNILTTEYAASNTYNTSDTFDIKAYFVNNIMIASQDKIIIGQGTLNGTFVSANTHVVLEYNNNNSLSKKMTFHIEYVY
jgi:hypothetical protein